MLALSSLLLPGIQLLVILASAVIMADRRAKVYVRAAAMVPGASLLPIGI